MAVIGVSKANREGVAALEATITLLEQREWSMDFSFGSQLYQALKDTQSPWYSTAYTWIAFTIDPERANITLSEWEHGSHHSEGICKTKKEAIQLLQDTIKRIVEGQHPYTPDDN